MVIEIPVEDHTIGASLFNDQTLDDVIEQLESYRALIPEGVRSRVVFGDGVVQVSYEREPTPEEAERFEMNRRISRSRGLRQRNRFDWISTWGPVFKHWV